jgi:hypothetical protein
LSTLRRSPARAAWQQQPLQTVLGTDADPYAPYGGLAQYQALIVRPCRKLTPRSLLCRRHRASKHSF